LKRLAKLYGMVEGLHALEVKAAAASVFEVDRALESLTMRRLEGAVGGRDGVARGSRVEALSAEKSAEQDRARAELLARVAQERRLQLEAAVLAHRESRMETRQIDGLAGRLLTEAELERDRRDQAESDDRFVSRQIWMRGGSGERLRRVKN
jgi:hypothetical protein